MRLTIYTTATSGYERALANQARRIIAGLALEKRIEQKDIQILLVTDKCASVKEAYDTYEKGLPEATIMVMADERLGSNFDNYKTDSQLLIAQMRTMATQQALAFGSDRCLSLDGDVLPPHNAIRCMMDMLEFDNGYYSVAFCPYPSHGGGAFLGGRGTPRQPILPDAYDDEKTIPKPLLAERKSIRAALDKKPDEKTAEGLVERLTKLDKDVQQIQPNGNVFALNAKKWRRRGWFDMAYPAVGKGSVVPVDWTGCGCTMMNKEAISLCDWSGYEGKGTEDLFINFHMWGANGLRSCCLPHCPCDHVVRNPDPEKKLGEFVHVRVGHETDGECVGHLRQWHTRWYSHEAGERNKVDEPKEVVTTADGQNTEVTTK
jgi:hypothetical protein